MLTQQGAAVVSAAPEGAARVRPPAATVAWVWWALPIALTAALGLYRASTIVLWWDEQSTIDVAKRPVGGILATARNVDAVHTFYYLFMHFWISAFGSAPLTLRLPSVLAMCGATACTTAIGLRLFNRRVAVTASVIFALIPGVSRYAEEARSYGFVVLGSAAAILLLLRALEKPEPRRWAVYGTVLAATGALNLIALTALSAHAVVVAVSADPGRARRRDLFKPFALVVALVLLVVTPIIIFGAIEAPTELGDPAPASFADLPLTWRETGCSTAFSLLVLLALPLLGAHRRRGPAFMILAWATLPVLTVWGVSMHGLGFDVYARYLLFVLPAWSIAVAAAVDRIPGVHRVAFLAIVGVAAGAVTHDQFVLHGQLSHFDYDYPGPRFPAEDYPAAASIVEAGFRPGDAATFDSSQHLYLGVNYYLPADEHLSDIFVARTDVQQNSLTPLYCPSAPACLAGGPERVWMFETGDYAPFSTERVDWSLALLVHYRIVEVWHVAGITVTLLQR